MADLPLNRRIGDKVRTHGMSKTKFYLCWKNMILRCTNKKATGYKNYGGRGIKVCKRWRKFENFRDDMLSKYLKHAEEWSAHQTTLDRIDNEGNYCPKNCRWATWKDQILNKRKPAKINRKSKYEYSLNGKAMGLTQWANELGVTRNILEKRIRRGWTIEKTLTHNL